MNISPHKKSDFVHKRGLAPQRRHRPNNPDNRWISQPPEPPRIFQIAGTESSFQKTANIVLPLLYHPLSTTTQLNSKKYYHVLPSSRSTNTHHSWDTCPSRAPCPGRDSPAPNRSSKKIRPRLTLAQPCVPYSEHSAAFPVRNVTHIHIMSYEGVTTHTHMSLVRSV